MFSLGFLDSIISKIQFLIYYSVLGDLPERLLQYNSYLPRQLEERFCLKDSAKNPVKTMDISSLLNTDLGNLNDWSLILQDNLLTIYDTIKNFIFRYFHSCSMFIISKILTFPQTSQCQETFQRDYCSTIPTYHSNLKRRFYLKNFSKNPIKTMDISSLQNTDLGNLNESSLILFDDLLSIYDTI